jgi:hypothetical protein
MGETFIVDIQIERHRYRCDSPDKEAALEFMVWFLRGVKGEAEADIRFGQITSESSHLPTKTLADLQPPVPQ